MTPTLTSLKSRLSALVATPFETTGSNEWVAGRLLAHRSVSILDFIRDRTHDYSPAILMWARRAPDVPVSKRQAKLLDDIKIQISLCHTCSTESSDVNHSAVLRSMMRAKKWTLCNSFIHYNPKVKDKLAHLALLALSELPNQDWPAPTDPLLLSVFKVGGMSVFNTANWDRTISESAQVSYSFYAQISSIPYIRPEPPSKNELKLAKMLCRLFDHIDPRVANSPAWREVVDLAQKVCKEFSGLHENQLLQETVSELSQTLERLPFQARRDTLTQIATENAPSTRERAQSPRAM